MRLVRLIFLLPIPALFGAATAGAQSQNVCGRHRGRDLRSEGWNSDRAHHAVIADKSGTRHSTRSATFGSMREARRAGT